MRWFIIWFVITFAVGKFGSGRSDAHTETHLAIASENLHANGPMISFEKTGARQTREAAYDFQLQVSEKRIWWGKLVMAFTAGMGLINGVLDLVMAVICCQQRAAEVPRSTCAKYFRNAAMSFWSAACAAYVARNSAWYFSETLALSNIIELLRITWNPMALVSYVVCHVMGFVMETVHKLTLAAKPVLCEG